MATISDYLTSINSSKQAIKTAIAGKGVSIDDSTTLSDYASKIDSIASGGAGNLPDFVARTATDFSNSDITSVGDSAGNGYQNLVSLDLPNCTVIGIKGFLNCTALKTIKMDSLQEVKNNGFQGCSVLDNVKLPSIVQLGNASFYGCTAMTSIELGKNLTKITSASFGNCTALSTITINRKQDAIAGSPWGAPSTCTVNWTGTE